MSQVNSSIPTTAWTGGQYSLYRILLGCYLFVHFVFLLAWGTEVFSNEGTIADAAVSPTLTPLNIFAYADSPVAVGLVLTVAVQATVFFTMGWHDKIAALVLWYIWAAMFGRNPLTLNPGQPFIGWLLLVHVALPGSPYGSFTARARVDPDGGWRMPRSIYIVAWVVMALGYSYSGFTKLVSPGWVNGDALQSVLNNPLARPGIARDLLLASPPLLLKLGTWGGLACELLFAPLALFKPLRPLMWGAMVLMHLSLICLVQFAELSVGMLFIHLFTFNPKWLAARKRAERATVFYDGDCGLCHRAVRFVLAEDREDLFRLSPLQSAEFSRLVPESMRKDLPDSIVVWTGSGTLLVRSSAVVYILGELGGLWRIVAWLLRMVPTAVRDWGYDQVARVRKQIFAKPKDVCPLMPTELRERFVF